MAGRVGQDHGFKSLFFRGGKIFFFYESTVFLFGFILYNAVALNGLFVLI